MNTFTRAKDPWRWWESKWKKDTGFLSESSCTYKLLNDRRSCQLSTVKIGILQRAARICFFEAGPAARLIEVFLPRTVRVFSLDFWKRKVCSSFCFYFLSRSLSLRKLGENENRIDGYVESGMNGERTKGDSFPWSILARGRSSAFPCHLLPLSLTGPL